jgi:ribosomal protein S27E
VHGARVVAVTVELRGEGDAQLRAIVRAGFPLLVRALAEHDRVLPRHVEREFSAYLGCGDPSAGFAWLECEDCKHHRLVLFSCKTRGFCPSCAGRRMAERAAHLVDRVLPHVATRQWVLTVPWTRRWLLARRSDLADGVLRVALRTIGQWYRQTTGRTGGKSGSVTSIQRFGSALNLNLHFHVIHLDGVFDRGADDALRFFEATPTTDDIEALVVEVGLACERWLGKQGFAGEAEDNVEDDDDAQGILQLASVSGTVATGERAGRRVKRVTMLGGKEFALGPRCAAYEGYNLHANVALAATERVALERLCRYILRPLTARSGARLRGRLRDTRRLVAGVPRMTRHRVPPRRLRRPAGGEAPGAAAGRAGARRPPDRG